MIFDMVNKASPAADQPIPSRLRALRKAEGFETAKAFAEMLDVTPNRYGNIEAGSSLSIDIAQRIVKMVPGCSLDWLYNGVENGLSVSLRQRLLGDKGEKARTTASRSGKAKGRSSTT